MSRPADPITLLAHADLFLWIADHLRTPSRQKNEASSPEQLDQLASRCLVGTDWTGSRLRDLERDLASLPPDALPGEYARLFEGAIACPINETAYIRRDKGVILADLKGFYRAFGFTDSRSTGEKPDHLIAELEFLGVLLVMLAQAEMNANEDRVTVTKKALVDFGQDHLGEWIDLFCDRLAATATIPALVQCAVLLRETWDVLRRRFDLQPAEPGLVRVEEDDSTSPYDCGMCP